MNQRTLRFSVTGHLLSAMAVACLLCGFGAAQIMPGGGRRTFARGGCVVAAALAEQMGHRASRGHCDGAAGPCVDSSSPVNARQRRDFRGRESAERGVLHSRAAGDRIRRGRQGGARVGRPWPRIRLAAARARPVRRLQGQRLDQRQCRQRVGADFEVHPRRQVSDVDRPTTGGGRRTEQQQHNHPGKPARGYVRRSENQRSLSRRWRRRRPARDRV